MTTPPDTPQPSRRGIRLTRAACLIAALLGGLWGYRFGRTIGGQGGFGLVVAVFAGLCFAALSTFLIDALADRLRRRATSRDG